MKLSSSVAAKKAGEAGNVQTISGLKLKLTQAGANYVNRALKRRACWARR